MTAPATTDPTASTLFPHPAFQAWRRAGKGRWRVAASGATERECWEALVRVMDEAEGHNDSIILAYPQEP